MVAVIILALRLSQYYYLIIDRDAGIMESLRLSLEVTRGNAGNLFVIGFVTGLINLAGLLACGVGLIFTIPFTVLVFPVTYLALTGQPIADPRAPGSPRPIRESSGRTAPSRTPSDVSHVTRSGARP